MEQRAGAALPARLFLVALAVAEASLLLVRAMAGMRKAARSKTRTWHGGRLQAANEILFSFLVSLSCRCLTDFPLVNARCGQRAGRAVRFGRAAEWPGAAPVPSRGSRRCSDPELVSSAWRVAPDVVPARGMGSGRGHHGKAAQRVAGPRRVRGPGTAWSHVGGGRERAAWLFTRTRRLPWRNCGTMIEQEACAASCTFAFLCLAAPLEMTAAHNCIALAFAASVPMI